jgi:membrane fusion protein (multidrug efflux system)
MAEPGPDSGKDTGNDRNNDPGATRKKRFKVLGVVLLVLAVAGLVWWLMTRNHETTDDAFIDGTVIQVSPQVGGRVVAVHFADNDMVHQGDLLVEIDPRDYQAALDAAKASLDAATARRQGAAADLDLTRVTSGADYTRAEGGLASARERVAQARSTADAAQADAVRTAADLPRYRELFAGRNASRQRLDQAVADAAAAASRWRAAKAAVADADAQVAQATAQVRSASTAAEQVKMKEAALALADAQVEQAEASLRTAELNLSYTRVTAPESGRVSAKAVSVGDSVQKDQSLTQLVAGPPWVVANFKETQLTRMRPGQPATVSVDSYPGVKLTGHVDSVQPGTGARFSLLPAENATGNYVKVVQRVPVKIVLDDPAAAPFLALGMSVVPDVDVGARPEPPHVAGAAP